MLSGTGRLACYFQFDSLATVCFLSISSAADLTFLHGLPRIRIRNFK